MVGRGRTGKLAVGAALCAALGLTSLLVARRLGASSAIERERLSYPPLDVPKAVADDVWIVDSGPISAMGLKLPIRMTVVRLTGGDLILHSPVCLTPDLANEIARLGTVRHLVAPNIAHWSFLSDWQQSFPEAVTWGAPGLRERAQVQRSKVRIDRDLADTAPAEWSAEIEQGIVPGSAGFSEVYFFHRASRTLILTDLVQNLAPGKLPPVTRIVMQLSGATRARAGAHLRAIVKLAGSSASDAASRMMALQPERVIFAHGRWFDRNGSARLRRSLDWLVPETGG